MVSTGTVTDGVVKKFSDGVLEIHDASANDVTVILAESSFQYSESQARIWHKERGAIDHSRAGDIEPVTCSFNVKYTAHYATGSDVTPYEALKKVDGASAWVSTTAATSDVYAVDLVLTITDPVNGSNSEILTINDFSWEKIDFAEGEEMNTMSFSGTATSVTPTYAP